MTKYPGNNKMELNEGTLLQLIQTALNEGRAKSDIRVLSVKPSHSYSSEMEVRFTTDPEGSDDEGKP